MLTYRRIIRKSACRIAAAANRTVDDLASQRIEHEPEFTSEMIGRMKETMNGYRVGGVHWTAKTLTSHGANAQERRFGADFVGVLDLDLPEYKVRKGFLAQAKRIEGRGGITGSEWGRMTDQCRTMLSITSESFVFIYSPQSIAIVPALAIVSARRPSNLTGFYSRSVLRFYEDHFECFVGDERLHTADIKSLEQLEARNGLLLRASAEELGLLLNK